MKPLALLLSLLAGCTSSPSARDGVACEPADPTRPRAAPLLIGGTELVRWRLDSLAAPGRPASLAVADVFVGVRGRADSVRVVRNTSGVADAEVAARFSRTEWQPGDARGRPARFRCRVSVPFGGAAP